MKVFISWSGSISHKVAIALRDWLPSVIQAVDPFVSSEDIERGARWFLDVGDELEKVHFGILCITPQNINAPWILFEAGALSKSVDQSRVSPLLVGVKNSDIEGPLSQFNTTGIEQADVLKLIKTINKQLKNSSLPEQTLEKAFLKWWPDLEGLLLDALKEAEQEIGKEVKPKRSQEELLEEILDLTRGISRQITTGGHDKWNKNLVFYILSHLNNDSLKMNLTPWNKLSKLKGKDFNAADFYNFIIPDPDVIENWNKIYKDDKKE